MYTNHEFICFILNRLKPEVGISGAGLRLILQRGVSLKKLVKFLNFQLS